jgi:hypothetical protein
VLAVAPAVLDDEEEDGVDDEGADDEEESLEPEDPVSEPDVGVAVDSFDPVELAASPVDDASFDLLSVR